MRPSSWTSSNISGTQTNVSILYGSQQRLLSMMPVLGQQTTVWSINIHLPFTINKHIPQALRWDRTVSNCFRRLVSARVLASDTSWATRAQPTEAVASWWAGARWTTLCVLRARARTCTSRVQDGSQREGGQWDEIYSTIYSPGDVQHNPKLSLLFHFEGRS